MIAPKVEETAETMPNVKFIKVNLERCEGALSTAMGVKSLPTFVAFKGGEKQSVHIGANLPKFKSWVGGLSS